VAVVSVLSNVLFGIDQIVNCLVRIDGEWGEPDETLSARAYRVREAHPRWQAWIDRLFFWEDGHCEDAWRNELLRAHFPKESRT
jgi:hypothetical protein